MFQLGRGSCITDSGLLTNRDCRHRQGIGVIKRDCRHRQRIVARKNNGFASARDHLTKRDYRYNKERLQVQTGGCDNKEIVQIASTSTDWRLWQPREIADTNKKEKWIFFKGRTPPY